MAQYHFNSRNPLSPSTSNSVSYTCSSIHLKLSPVNASHTIKEENIYIQKEFKTPCVTKEKLDPITMRVDAATYGFTLLGEKKNYHDTHE